MGLDATEAGVAHVLMAQPVLLNNDTHARLLAAYAKSKRVHGRQYYNYTFQTYCSHLMTGALEHEEYLKWDPDEEKSP
jgi:hypothetical protein